MRPGSSIRREAQVFILVLLLAGCGATTSRTNDDLTTSTQVKIALLSDTQVGGLRLDVKTFQGVVTLAGAVRSAADEQRAIALAKRIQGVRDVRSQLKVAAPDSRMPEQ
jgi:hyperosmotically inducible protein